MQGTQAGLQGLGTALQGTGLGLQGVSGAQQGYQGATQAGAALGNIGAQQGQYQLGALALQNQIANQQYQQPFSNLNFMQGMMGGLPVNQSTQQGYQAPPNYLSQLTGAGLTGLGIYGLGKNLNWWGGSGGGGGGSGVLGNMMDDDGNLMPVPGATGGHIKDGDIKRYSTGGDINLVPTDKLGPMMQSPNIDPMDAALIQKELIERARMASNPQTAQIMGGGLDTIPSGDMFRAAGGGIVAFAGTTDGSLVKKSKIPDKISEHQAWLEDTIRSRMENLEKGNPFERSQALEQQYADAMKERQAARPYETLIGLGAGIMSGDSPYALSNIGKGGLYAIQQQQKAAAEDSADRKLLLQQAVEQEKSKYGREMGNLGSLQTSLGQMYSKEIGRLNAGASAASTQAYRDQLLVQKYATLWKDTLDDTKDTLLKQTKFNSIYRKDPTAFNRLAEQEAKRQMPKVALDLLGKTPALADTSGSGGGTGVPTLPPNFELVKPR